MAAPFIIAIDPAINSGFCEGVVGKTPTLHAERFPYDPEEIEVLYGAATVFFATFLKARKPDLIAIESPIMAAWGKTNAKTTDVTRGLYAIITGIATAKSIPILRADIGTWRKWFLGRGNLKGKDAKAQCVMLCKQFGWHAPDHNAAEAAGIWSWAGSKLDPRLATRVEPLFVPRAEPSVLAAG